MRKRIPQSRVCICGHPKTNHYRSAGCNDFIYTKEGADVCNCRCMDFEWWQQALPGTLTHRWIRGFWTREQPWVAREPQLPMWPEVPSSSDLDIL